jgi:hypothetical protein
VNGARSAGPVTIVGKTVSAANAIRQGYAAQGALMPGETPEQYEANVVAWFDSLRPANAAEAKLVARLADVDFRQERLGRALRAGIPRMAKVSETPLAGRLRRHELGYKNTLDALRSALANVESDLAVLLAEH